jgi:alkylhydroperoxidase/carboxymuconolactone decarboxylase family protein YurZ
MKNNKFSDNLTKSIIKIAAYLALKDWNNLDSELKNYISNNYNLQFVDEIFLTSYLFLGFPAMITAFEMLRQSSTHKSKFKLNRKNNYSYWKNKGLKLFRKIYDDKSEKLLLKVKKLHPEVANWMLTEGYGKVLSRKFLPINIREIIIITFLIINYYPKQLYSHLKGALNVGVSTNEINILFLTLKEININNQNISAALEMWQSINNL